MGKHKGISFKRLDEADEAERDKRDFWVEFFINYYRFFPNDRTFKCKVIQIDKNGKIFDIENECMKIANKVIEATKLPYEHNSICSLISDYAAITEKDKEIIDALVAVEKDCNALTGLKSHLQKNYQVVMTAIKNNGCILRFVVPDLQDNFQIVMAAVVKSYGSALEFASLRLKNNFQIVMAAVKQDGDALEFASPELNRNSEIVFEALNRLLSKLKI